MIDALTAEGAACVSPGGAGGMSRWISVADLTGIVETTATRPATLGCRSCTGASASSSVPFWPLRLVQPTVAGCVHGVSRL